MYVCFNIHVRFLMLKSLFFALFHIFVIRFTAYHRKHKFRERTQNMMFIMSSVKWSFLQYHAIDYLYYSPNAGNTIIKMLDLKNDVIQLFETSQHGYFVFVTKRRMVSYNKLTQSNILTSLLFVLPSLLIFCTLC